MTWRGRARRAAVLGLALLLAAPAGGVDRGAVWAPGGITAQQDGATFAVLPLSDGLTLLYTRVPSTTQLRVFQSPDAGQTVALAQDAIVTGRTQGLNPNAALLLASGQTLLGGYVQGTEGATPEAPWLRGTGAVWSTPAVTGLPTIGPTAAPFPAPFPTSPVGFLRAVAIAASGTTLLSVVDNNSSNPPVVCRSTNQAVSFACVAMPGSIGTVRWRDPQSGSVSAPGTAQPLASPSPTRWLLLDSLAQVYRSLDDGLTWTLVTRLTTDTSVSWAITCLPAVGTCVALTSSFAAGMIRLFRSTDGGATWTAAFTVPRGDLLTTLVAAGGNTVLALGDPSAAPPVLFGLQSQDGGVTWFPVVSPRRALWGGAAPITALSAGADFFSGFEEINTNLTTWNAGTPATTTANARAVGPGRSALSDSIGGFGLVRTTGFATCAVGPCTLALRWYVRLNTFTCSGGGAAQVARLGSVTNPAATRMHAVAIGYQCIAGVLTDPRIAVEDSGAGVAAVSGTTNLTTGVWYRLEWTFRFSLPDTRTSSVAIFAEDAGLPFNSLSYTSIGAGATVAEVSFGNSISGGGLGTLEVQLDDVSYRSEGAASGPAAVWTVPPTGDVSVAWSPASANWTHVDDVPGTPDDAADVVTTSTVNATDRFTVAPLTGVPLGWKPARGLVNYRVGSGGATGTMAGRAWDSLGQTLTGPTFTWSTTYTAATAALTTFNPNGAEVADVAEWNIGYQYLGAGGEARMTAVWLSVELAPDPGSGGGGDSALGDAPSPFWQNQAPYVRADGSVIVWTFWSNVLGADTPSYLQAFNAAPTIPTAAGGFPQTPDGQAFVSPAGARLSVPRGDVAVSTTATAVLGGNQTRVRATCVNHGPDAVRIGDGTVTATRGVRVGSTRPFSTSSVATVYAIAELTTATVSCSEDLP